MAIAILLQFPQPSVDPGARTAGLAQALALPPGSRHVWFETTGGVKVLIAWETDEEFAQFGQRLGPLLAKLDVHPSPAGDSPVLLTL